MSCSYTTPTHDPAMRLGGAGPVARSARPGRKKAASIATPLSVLHRRFREIANKHDEIDELAVSLPEGPARDAASAELETLLSQALALRDKAATLPAQTLEDAAIQALFAYYLLEVITVREDNNPDAGAIQTFLASIVLALSRIGAFDISQIGWGDARNLRAFRALMGSAAE